MQSRDADPILRELMRLKNALIYFASSLRQNIVVAEKLLNDKNLTEDDVETLENIIVEIKQAFATCNIQRELMTETMSTYSNIVSNQLAERMRLLTIVTIILAIPTLIAGIYGMNIRLPLDHLPGLGSFFLIISVATIICLLSILWMVPNRHTFSPKKKTKRKRRRNKAQDED